MVRIAGHPRGASLRSDLRACKNIRTRLPQRAFSLPRGHPVRLLIRRINTQTSFSAQNGIATSTTRHFLAGIYRPRRNRVFTLTILAGYRRRSTGIHDTYIRYTHRISLRTRVFRDTCIFIPFQAIFLPWALNSELVDRHLRRLHGRSFLPLCTLPHDACIYFAHFFHLHHLFTRWHFCAHCFASFPPSFTPVR